METRAKNVHGLRGPCPHASIDVVSTHKVQQCACQDLSKPNKFWKTILCEIILSFFSSGTEFQVVSKL